MEQKGWPYTKAQRREGEKRRERATEKGDGSGKHERTEVVLF
jgi:hypothetical protein